MHQDADGMCLSRWVLLGERLLLSKHLIRQDTSAAIKLVECTNVRAPQVFMARHTGRRELEIGDRGGIDVLRLNGILIFRHFLKLGRNAAAFNGVLP